MTLRTAQAAKTHGANDRQGGRCDTWLALAAAAEFLLLCLPLSMLCGPGTHVGLFSVV